jgi:pyruvate dehydrogenase E2 component (dihydrolipoamide acetyltransferase)
VAAIQEVRVPDIGDFDQVDVIEVLVNPGDAVGAGDSLITLESDKASMEVPSPSAGVVRDLRVHVGDKIGENAVILTLDVSEAAPAASPDPDRPPAEAERAATPPPRGPAIGSAAPAPGGAVAGPGQAPRDSLPPSHPAQSDHDAAPRGRLAHASPSVRRFARELGVDVSRVTGTGRKRRVLKQDVQGFIKERLSASPAAGALPEMPRIDFSKFGPIETRSLSRIRKISAAHLHRSWLHIPHVTQFDEADITDLEAFRTSRAAEAKEKGVKLTLLPFLMKASGAALREFPEFNASLDPDGEQLILKQYCHIGVAVDTSDGLVVPVVRDVDSKGLFELADELAAASQRARDGKLSVTDIQGGGFTISSLGGIGGTGFTPIINAPEVAILGVSRTTWKPVYRDGTFEPRLVLPFALSYDHRVIDGAAAVRFTTFLGAALSDVRRLSL